MPKITLLPHIELAPAGAEVTVPAGTSICDALLDNRIGIEHACGKVGACTTCHIVVRRGFSSLGDASENEEDMLDRAWGVEPHSRLACQAIVADADLTVDIPRYSINHAKENE
ncbi:ISC system 2Fe-2S type ferredoxin [Massilia soli]|uniref:2Fe-2S ferredoxin n=1 Tax=Massilia soli TaxID=2792854 RepID=A0ABS7SNB7_9BURK|nr:ISC system 2Fe-2S type ferredoxin [Massilia soli]MBZ2207376.1 ISC system 2Fe-2S type ferredoxin [Massilia soli]